MNNETFFVFCKQTTRAFVELGSALNAAWYESAITRNASVPVYTHATDGSISKVVATVTANE